MEGLRVGAERLVHADHLHGGDADGLLELLHVEA